MGSKKNASKEKNTTSTPTSQEIVIEKVVENIVATSDNEASTSNDTGNDTVLISESNNDIEEDTQVVTMSMLRDLLLMMKPAEKKDKKGKKKVTFTNSDTDTNDTSDSMSSSKKTILAEQNLSNHLFHEVPKYDGESDIQKLMEFIDKIENYFEMVEFSPLVELKAASSKLIGTAGLLWRHHKSVYPNREDVGRIKTWSQLKDMLLKNKITAEHERYILGQLDIIQQKGNVMEYNNEFNKLTMQLTQLPSSIEIHYYLKGLKKEIRQLVESNNENLVDIMTLKQACLRQDYINNLNLTFRSRQKKMQDESTLTVQDHNKHGNGRGNFPRGKYISRVAHSSRGGYNNNGNNFRGTGRSFYSQRSRGRYVSSN